MQIVKALGRTFHEEHFNCTACSKPLGNSQIFENEGYPYCEADYLKIFCDACGYCREPITDVSCLRTDLAHSLTLAQRCVSALGKKWHVDHFFCMSCGKEFKDGGFLEKGQ